MKYIVTIALLLLFCTAGIAQISYEKRLELELKDGYGNEKIQEFGEHGFIMSSKNEDNIGGEQERKFDLYNSSLELVKTKKVLLNKRYYLDEYYSGSERMHILYKEKKGGFSIVTVDASTLEVTVTEGEVPKKSYISDMAVYGDFAYFSASIKGEPFLFSVNWKTGVKKLIPISLPGIKPRNASLMGFQVIERAKKTFLFLKATVDKKTMDIYVVKLNENGQKEGIFNLTEKIDKNIIDVTASQLEGDQFIFTGTYSARNIGLSQGLYFCRTTGDKIDFIEFYNFLDLKNFLTYLPERKQEKLEKKKKKKEDKGKEMSLNYRIAAHGIINLEDGYLFLGEAYYPTYRTETYTTTSTSNGVTTTTTHTRTVFDGYQYTHAMFGKFDKQGKLLWDQIFEMKSTYKPFVVKRFISIAEQKQNSIKLVYTSRNKIFSKSIDFSGTVLQEAQSEELKTNFEGDKSKNTFSNIDFWYDNYFIAYGTQVIKNKDEGDKRKRKVYFVSKIKYE